MMNLLKLLIIDSFPLFTVGILKHKPTFNFLYMYDLDHVVLNAKKDDRVITMTGQAYCIRVGNTVGEVLTNAKETFPLATICRGERPSTKASLLQDSHRYG